MATRLREVRTCPRADGEPVASGAAGRLRPARRPLKRLWPGDRLPLWHMAKKPPYGPFSGLFGVFSGGSPRAHAIRAKPRNLSSGISPFSGGAKCPLGLWKSVPKCDICNIRCKPPFQGVSFGCMVVAGGKKRPG